MGLDVWSAAFSGVRPEFRSAPKMVRIVGAGQLAFRALGKPEDEMNLALTRCKPNAIRCRMQEEGAWQWRSRRTQRASGES